MSGNCVKESVVYQATVSTEDHNPPQTYVGLTENSFKTTISDKIVRAKHLFGLYSPLAPQYNVDYCHNNILKQHSDFYCKRYLPKSNIVKGGGVGELFKIEIYIE